MVFVYSDFALPCVMIDCLVLVRRVCITKDNSMCLKELLPRVLVGQTIDVSWQA